MNVAIGVSGMEPLEDYRGTFDRPPFCRLVIVRRRVRLGRLAGDEEDAYLLR